MENFKKSLHEGYGKALQKDADGPGFNINLAVVGEIEADEEARETAFEQQRLIQEAAETNEKDIAEIKAEIEKLNPENTLRQLLERILDSKYKKTAGVDRVSIGGSPTLH